MRIMSYSAVGTALALVSIGLFPAPAADGSVAVERSAQRIAFTRSHTGDDSVLWTSRPDGAHQRRVIRGPVFFPAWSPDHKKLIFDFPDDQGNEQIATVRANGSHFRQLTDLPGISESPDYSPRGNRVIFGRFSPDQPVFYTSLWVMRADGSHPHALFGPDSTTFDVEPEYSPDGSRIVFARISADFEKVALFVANSNGSHRRRITPYTAGLEHPRWAPDGRRIVYNIADSQTPKDGIYLVRPNGHNRHRIFESDRLVGFKPDFSPNGNRILFGCFVIAQRQDDLCKMRANGEGVQRIVRTPNVFENFPVWD